MDSEAGINFKKNKKRAIIAESWCVRTGKDGGVKLTFFQSMIDGSGEEVVDGEKRKEFYHDTYYKKIGIESEIIAFHIESKTNIIYVYCENEHYYKLLTQNQHKIRQEDKKKVIDNLRRKSTEHFE